MNKDDFTPCEDCVDIDKCLTQCAIQAYWLENTNIAEQRGETQEQLLGDAQ